MKKINLILIGLLFTTQLLSQTKENSVSLTTSGTGKSIEEAKNNALRSAIEQAFGAFISSKTELLNDEVVSDQITSVTSGNIQSFEIKSQDKLPNELWSITISCIVAVDKLISFVQSKGISVEIKGGLFSINVKQQILNEKAETENIIRLIGNIHEPLQNAFDYGIEVNEPKSIDDNNENWLIGISVVASTNNNFYELSNYITNTIKSISLSESELEQYNKLNKNSYLIKIKNGNEISDFYLRRIESIYALQTLATNFKVFYGRQFSITSSNKKFDFKGSDVDFEGKHELFPVALTEPCYPNQSLFHNEYNYRDEYKTVFCFMDFPKTKTNIKESYKSIILKLPELESISEFKLNPSGVVSKFGFGGFVIDEQIVLRVGLFMNKENLNIIDSVMKNGACDKAGLKSGDIIKSINGIKYEGNFIDLCKLSNSTDKMSKVEIIRNLETLFIDVTPTRKMQTIVIYPFTFGWSNYVDAKKITENLESSGYSDWILPNFNIMRYINSMIFKNIGIGNHLSYKRRYGAIKEFYWCQNGDNFVGLEVSRSKNYDRDPDNKDKITNVELKTEITNETGFFIPYRIQLADIK
jgi:hypothetical protein